MVGKKSGQSPFYYGEIFSRISVISDTLEEYRKNNYESFRLEWGKLIASNPKNQKVEDFLRRFYRTALINFGEYTLGIIPKKPSDVVDFASVRADIEDFIGELRSKHPQIKELVSLEKRMNRLYKVTVERLDMITSRKKEKKKDFWTNIAVNIFFLLVGVVLGYFIQILF